jgi:hypothetical protein
MCGSAMLDETVGRTAGQTSSSGGGSAGVRGEAGTGTSAAVPSVHYPNATAAVEDTPLYSFRAPIQHHTNLSGAAATQNNDGNLTVRAALVSASGSAGGEGVEWGGGVLGPFLS